MTQLGPRKTRPTLERFVWPAFWAGLVTLAGLMTWLEFLVYELTH